MNVSNRKGQALGIGLAFLLLATLPLALPELRAILLMAIAEAIAALGVMMLLRAGQISFGHALYFTCGAYTVAFGSHHLGADVLVVVPLAVVTSALLGALLGSILARYRGIFFAMLNLAFTMVGFNLLLKLYSVTGGSDGVRVGQHTIAGLAVAPENYGWAIYGVATVALVVALAVTARYLASPMGQALPALKTNETRLEYLGISGRAVLYSAYVGSAALAGLGGALVALGTGHVTPELAYWAKAAEFVFIAVFGGMGSVLGPLLGAVAFGLIRSYASVFAADAWQLILGAVLVAVVLFAPLGLVGLVKRIFMQRGTGEQQ